MPFVERLMGLAEPKIPVEYCKAAVYERARGSVNGQPAQFATDAEIQAFIVSISGAPLTAAELVQFKGLATSISSNSGSAAGPTAQRAERAHALSDTFNVIEAIGRDPNGPALYRDPALIRVRLGLPNPEA